MEIFATNGRIGHFSKEMKSEAGTIGGDNLVCHFFFCRSNGHTSNGKIRLASMESLFSRERESSDAIRVSVNFYRLSSTRAKGKKGKEREGKEREVSSTLMKTLSTFKVDESA